VCVWGGGGGGLLVNDLPEPVLTRAFDAQWHDCSYSISSAPWSSRGYPLQPVTSHWGRRDPEAVWSLWTTADSGPGYWGRSGTTGGTLGWFLYWDCALVLNDCSLRCHFIIIFLYPKVISVMKSSSVTDSRLTTIFCTEIYVDIKHWKKNKNQKGKHSKCGTGAQCYSNYKRGNSNIFVLVKG